MPSGNIKNIPRRVNLDDDIRVLENYDLRAARNIRIMSSSGAEAGAVENIKSDIEITIPNFPSGTNKQIGSIAHTEQNDLYIFFHSSTGNHCIVRYNSITEKARIVLKNSLLKFSRTSFVNGFAVTGNNINETLLYWTDNVNQPRSINVKRAERHTDADYTNGYPNPLTEEYIRWVKYPPITAPTIEHGEDPSIVYNNISSRVFQFRYRYYFKDGEYSAYSPISDISVSKYQAKNSAFAREEDLTFNYVNITVDNAWQDVSNIEVVCREGNEGAWLTAKILENGTVGTTQDVRFYNDDTYIPADINDTLKNYDAVPLSAAACEYVANRAVLGNATDGFDNISQATLDGSVTFGARYLPNEDLQPVIIASSGLTGAGTTRTPTFDTSGLTIAAFDTILIDFNSNLSYSFGATTVTTNDRYRFEWTAAPTETVTDFLTAAIAHFNGLTKVGTKCSGAANVSSDLQLTIASMWTATTLSITNVTAKQIKGGDGSLSFKAGAKHPLGVVYHDEAGRHCTVQRPANNAPYVSWFSERGANENGRAIVDWRIGHTPPIWAKRYQIVYGGNSSVGEFLQYTTAAAYVDVNTASKDSNKNIYLTFHNFLGTDDDNVDSYVTSRKPLLNYSYKEGDRLRVIKRPNGVLVTDRAFDEDYHDFKILGFEFFEKDVATNPFYVAGTNASNRSGWTLIIENPENVDDFSHAEVAADLNNNGWYQLISGGQGHSCLVEIYNINNRNNENVFYEFGEEYEIVDAGLSTRAHDGYRQQGVNIVAKTVTAINDSPAYIKLDYGKIPPTLFVGDVIEFAYVNASTPVGNYTITRVQFDEAAGEWVFYIDGAAYTSTLDSVTTVALADDYLFAGGSLNNGDVWLKPRYLVTGATDITDPLSGRLVLQETVEDYYANDFFPSNYWNKGRPHAFSKYAKKEERKATVWISEPFFPDTKTNGLSAFNLSGGDLPFKDYDRSLGGIYLLKKRGDALIVYQENKVSNVMVNKETLKTGDGGDIIVLSGAVLGEQNPYVGDFGICRNPESHAEINGNHYFVDIKRGKALRLAQDGLTAISNYKFSSFFDDASRDYMSVINSSNLKIYGGFDREFGEYNITIEDLSTYKISIDDVDISYNTPKITIGEENIKIGLGFRKAKNIKQVIDAELFPINPSGVSENDLEDLVVSGEISLSDDDIAIAEVEDTVPIGVTVEGTVLESTYSVIDNELTIPLDNGTVAVAATLVGNIPSVTVVFHEDSNYWLGHRDYTPSGYAAINFSFFSFKDGTFWHGQGADYNTFYGTEYPSKLSPIIKTNPSQVTMLKSVSLEGNQALDAVAVTSELNATSFLKERFTKMEGMFYADVPMATTTVEGVKYYKYGIGVVTDVDAILDKLTFSGQINEVGIMYGDLIKNAADEAISATILDVSADSNYVLEVSSVTGFSIGQFLIGYKVAKEEGEPVRGYAFRVDLSQDADNQTDRLELYAINGHVALSNLTIGS